MAQQFIPEITEGDKRVLLIDGKAVPYALARVPAIGETRGNLAAGGSGIGVTQQTGPLDMPAGRTGVKTTRNIICRHRYYR